MLGWFADLFRLAWGLLYWNARKSWFQRRRGRSACPCQSLSDSGRALETQCEAAAAWDRPKRFRRVCPLLVETPQGLRCSVNTEDVRPFWGRAAAFYGGALMACYAAGVIVVFSFLRTIGYPISIVHVALPPLWHRVGQARGWFFVERANRAFAAGKMAEGLLYLHSAYDYDPQQNYEAGMTLAKVLQAGQPGRSDEMFQRLLHDHPGKRAATSQDWFRSLLARGEFEKIAGLAREQILADPRQAPVWIRALFFAVRESGNDQPLQDLLGNPAAQPWHDIIAIEELLRAGKKSEARLALERPWPDSAHPFTLYYRINALTELGAALPATDLLAKNSGRLDPEAEVTLLLDALAVNGSEAARGREIDRLLAGRFDAARMKIVCAHLIRHPKLELFDRVWATIERTAPPMNDETVGAWFSVLTCAGAVGDKLRLHQLTSQLKTASSTPFIALGLVEAFFRGETADRRVTSFLPLLPLPLEVTYALLERYSPTHPMVAIGASRE